MDIKDKIRKLLALGTSPNENEAKAALLKAKQLMMENKLTEDDLVEHQVTLEHKYMEDIRWTTDSGDIWMVSLCDIIAENYLCAASWNTVYRTHTLYLTGLTGDIDICIKAIEFAVGVIKHSIKIMQRKYKTFDAKSVRQSYARGFVEGLRIAFENQRSEHREWALVETKPQKVKDYEDGLASRSIQTRQSMMNANTYAVGVDDGMKFNMNRVLEG